MMKIRDSTISIYLNIIFILMLIQTISQRKSSVFLVCQSEMYERFVQAVIVHIIGNMIRGEIGLSMSNLDHHNHNDSDQQ